MNVVQETELVGINGKHLKLTVQNQSEMESGFTQNIRGSERLV